MGGSGSRNESRPKFNTIFQYNRVEEERMNSAFRIAEKINSSLGQKTNKKSKSNQSRDWQMSKDRMALYLQSEQRFPHSLGWLYVPIDPILIK